MFLYLIIKLKKTNDYMAIVLAALNSIFLTFDSVMLLVITLLYSKPEMDAYA